MATAPNGGQGFFDRLQERLRDDRTAIEHAFGLRAEDIVGTNAGLGDPHAGGQTVTRIDYAGGRALYYKPRAVRLERAFSDVLDWMTSEEIAFDGLSVLDRGTYGWVLGVNACPCASLEEIRRFHVRAGGLLAVTYTLGATDLHEENVIARGEHPVLLDLETLVSPMVTPAVDGDDRLVYSVFDVGFLPSIQPEGPHGAGRLSGGLGGGLMDRSATNNLPRLAGDVVAPFPYRDDVMNGFRSTWRQLRDCKQALLDLCAAILADAPYRLVLRPTAVYRAALAATEEEHGERERRLALARTLGLPEVHDPEAVLGQELASLVGGDIPCFTGTVATRGIRGDDDARDLFEVARSPWEMLVERLERLGDDEERELARIRLAFDTASGEACSTVRRPAQLELESIDTREGGIDWLRPRRFGDHWQLARADLDERFAMGVLSAEQGRRDLAVRSFRWQRGARRQLVAADARVRPEDAPTIHALVEAMKRAAHHLDDDPSLLEDARAWEKLLP